MRETLVAKAPPAGAVRSIEGPAADHDPGTLGDCSITRAEITRLCERWLAAEQRGRQAKTLEDREAAAAEMEDVAGARYRVLDDIANFFLQGLRLATDYQRDALTLYLADLLAGELKPICDALARLEARR
jgi:hypothetical protein